MYVWLAGLTPLCDAGGHDADRLNMCNKIVYIFMCVGWELGE